MARLTLAPGEREELTRTIRDPERFHSDGREVLWACVTIPVLCVPLLAVLFADARQELGQIASGEILVGTGLLFAAPELIGFGALFAAAAWIAAYGVRTFGRHGVVITTFGVARIRGGLKRLIRFAEIESLSQGERSRPMHSVITGELEVKAKDGRAIMLYGFGIGRWKALIEREMQSTKDRSSS